MWELENLTPEEIESLALQNMAAFGEHGPTEDEAVVIFLESVIEDQAFQIEALQLRISHMENGDNQIIMQQSETIHKLINEIDELKKNQCGC